MNNIILSRRKILQVGAVATPVLALGACSTSTSTPLTDTGTRTDAGSDAGSTEQQDIATLNALLSAEYGAIAAYTAGAGILTAPPANDPGAAAAPTYLQVAARFRQQHRDHASVLVATIMSAGGTPVAESSVTFTAPTGFTGTVTNVLKLACNAEKAAAVAYNNTVRVLRTRSNRLLASAIEGDETQHFMVLYALLKGVAAPGSAIAMTNLIVPVSFSATVMNQDGLDRVPALAFTA